MLAHIDETPLQGHPMIPLLQVTTGDGEPGLVHGDLDLVLQSGSRTSQALSLELLDLVLAAASQEYRPRLWSAGLTDFQLTRGWFGVSL